VLPAVFKICNLLINSEWEHVKEINPSRQKRKEEEEMNKNKKTNTTARKDI
jgi:hypothetical protein